MIVRLTPICALAMGLLFAAPCMAGTAPSRLKPGDIVPDFSFANQRSSRLTLVKLRPRAVLVTFIFTRCTAMEFCPRMSLKFQETRAALDASPWKHSVELLSVSLDPEHDTPDILGTYSKSFGARPGSWTFANCAPNVLTDLRSQFGVRATAGRNGSIEHNLVTALVDSRGRLRKIWQGNKWTTAEVLAEMPEAVMPVPKNKPGD